MIIYVTLKLGLAIKSIDSQSVIHQAIFRPRKKNKKLVNKIMKEVNQHGYTWLSPRFSCSQYLGVLAPGQPRARAVGGRGWIDLCVTESEESLDVS